MRLGNLVSENYSHPGRDLTCFRRGTFWGMWFAVFLGRSADGRVLFRETTALEGSVRLVSSSVVQGSSEGVPRGCSLEGFSCCQSCFSWWASCQAVVRFLFLGSGRLRAEEDGVYFLSRVRKTIVDGR